MANLTVDLSQLDTGIYETPDKSGLIEVLLPCQGFRDGLVNQGVCHQRVVVQVLEGRIEPVDSSVCLVEHLVRVGLRVENNRIRLDTVPALRPSCVLN